LFHWTPRRKAEVVDRILHEELSISEAAAQYSASLEELTAWCIAVQTYGVPGLRSTRLHCYAPERRGWRGR